MNRKELYLLAIIIFMTVVAWVSFGIFHARNKTSEYRVKAKNIEPLNRKKYPHFWPYSCCSPLLA